MRGFFCLLSLLSSQWKRPDRQRRKQEKRLRKLIHFAYKRVPFYRQKFQMAGITPDDIKGLDDLHKIPITTKQELQQSNIRDITAQGTNLKRCCYSRTSGATGIALEIVAKPSDRAAFHPSFLRTYMAWGYRPWHRAASFQARRERLKARSWYESLGVFRKQTIYSVDSPDSWISVLRQWRPYHVYGYVLTLKLLAEAIRKKGITDENFLPQLLMLKWSIYMQLKRLVL